MPGAQHGPISAKSDQQIDLALADFAPQRFVIKQAIGRVNALLTQERYNFLGYSCGFRQLRVGRYGNTLEWKGFLDHINQL